MIIYFFMYFFFLEEIKFKDKQNSATKQAAGLVVHSQSKNNTTKTQHNTSKTLLDLKWKMNKQLNYRQFWKKDIMLRAYTQLFPYFLLQIQINNIQSNKSHTVLKEDIKNI